VLEQEKEETCVPAQLDIDAFFSDVLEIRQQHDKQLSQEDEQIEESTSDEVQLIQTIV